MEKTQSTTRHDATLSEFQWQLIEIRTDIENRKLAGELSDDQELEIVMNALALINHIHADEHDLFRAQSLFWDAAGLAVGDRTKKLWEAIDIFIQ